MSSIQWGRAQSPSFFSLLRSAIMESLSWLYSFRTSVDRLPKKDTWRRRCDRFELESIYSPFLSFSSLARSRHRLYYRYRIQQLFIFPFCTFETETRLYRESFKLTSCHCRWRAELIKLLDISFSSQNCSSKQQDVCLIYIYIESLITK